jgi:hypothetical protein
MNIQGPLKRSEDTLIWVQHHLDGLHIGEGNKRVHLAAGCLHTAVEHGQAIVVLVAEGIYGSALALMRLQFEAYVRGIWLLHGATDESVDRAGQDKFPPMGEMITDLEQPGRFDAGILSRVKAASWAPLNSLTHTGYLQIGARLSAAGIGSNFEEGHVRDALNWADALAILAVVGFAGIAKNETLSRLALERARTIETSDATVV